MCQSAADDFVFLEESIFNERRDRDFKIMHLLETKPDMMRMLDEVKHETNMQQ
jgi:hypothetical protein